jgi:hypothetical protein
MAIDPSIALNKDRPDTLATLGQFVALGRQKTALERERGTLETDIEKSRADSSRAVTEADVAARTATPRVEQQGEQTEQSKIATKHQRYNLQSVQAQAGRDALTALYSNPNVIKASDPNLSDEERHKLADKIADDMADARDRLIRDSGIPRATAEGMVAPLMQQALNDPGTFRDKLGNIMRQSVGSSGQAGIAPGVMQQQGNGQQTVNNQLNPLAGPTGPVPGSMVQQQLSVGTPTANEVGTPGVIGPAPGTAPAAWTGQPPAGGPVPMAPQMAPQPGPAPGGVTNGPGGTLNVPPRTSDGLPGNAQNFPRIPPANQAAADKGGDRAQIFAEERARAVAAGDTASVAALDAYAAQQAKQRPAPAGQPMPAAVPAPVSAPAGFQPTGASPELQQTIKIVNADREKAAAEASGASERRGLLQSIRGLADEAIVGQNTDKRQIVAGIAAYLGNARAAESKASTDELIKDTAILAARSGDTDAARAMGEMASPNVKMQAAAIKAAANYLIARDTLALGKTKVLAPYASNPESYNQALRVWNENADPRVIQFMNSEPAEKARMVKGMTEPEIKAFRSKVGTLQQWGIIQ